MMFCLQVLLLSNDPMLERYLTEVAINSKKPNLISSSTVDVAKDLK